MGIHTNRYSRANASSFDARIANAITGAAIDAAISRQNGSASSAPAGWASPATSSTTVKTAHPDSARHST